jgi:two-component system, sensor histidine kinase and response regulator
MKLTTTISKTGEKTGDILIVDDTPNNLRFLSDLLGKAGYSVRKVISGEMGLEAAQIDPPDLILLDIKMPGLNGYKVCDRLKTSERTHDIPVIFLSAMDEELDKVMAFEAGGVDYITKPFQVVEVLVRIETHLQVSRLRKALQQQNVQLQQEIAQRASAETALDSLNQGLEAKIEAQTIDLRLHNEQILHRQTELQQALTQAERNCDLKAQALANLTDQIQAALEAITAAVNSLKFMVNPPEAAVQSIATSITTQTSIIQTALQSATPLEEGFTPQPVNLTQFCQTFVAQWPLPSQPAYQLPFVSWGKPTCPIQADPALLKRALAQLLANAVCYSPAGGTILVQLVYEPTQVLIQVRDEGVGISSAQLEKINDFYRIDEATPSVPGTGLLVIKQAIAPHGGTVSFSSELGQGTTVTLTLPAS